jgi:fibronectin type 3 domain-containing protein
VYVVRTVLSGEGSGVESSDSRTVTIKPVDTFPPAAPQGLVAAVIGEAAGGKTVVDLSWSINVEADLAGYRVYRSEQQGMLGEALNSELVATPSYRDTTGASGRKYWYSVKALDRAGNESKASEQVAVENQ